MIQDVYPESKNDNITKLTPLWKIVTATTLKILSLALLLVIVIGTTFKDIGTTLKNCRLMTIVTMCDNCANVSDDNCDNV